MPYYAHPSCLQPDDLEVPVWRFINLAKLLDLLSSRSLYFTPLQQFEDPYEGRPYGPPPPPEYITGSIEDSPPQFGRFQAYNRTHDFRGRCRVNCWHLAAHEPAAMWPLYPAGDAGIAICSTYKRLRYAFDHVERRVYMGGVQYPATSIEAHTSIEAQVMSKRPSFEHEREVRVFFFLDPSEVLPLM